MSSATNSALLTQELRVRASSTARRLVAGAGVASVVAYRHDAESSLGVPAHGLSASGDVVLAVRASDLPPDRPVEVRCDIRREATEARVRLLAATAHLLGSIVWLDELTLAAKGLTWLPPMVAVAAQAPEVRVGVLRSERLLLHDAAGVTPIESDVAFGPAQRVFPDPSEEFMAAEAIASLGERGLRDLVARVLTGEVAGRVLAESPVVPTCASQAGRIYTVDVDSTGLTLMHVGVSLTSALFIPFSEPVTAPADLERAIHDLTCH